MKKLLPIVLAALLILVNALPAFAASIISIEAQLDKTAFTPGSAVKISGKVLNNGAVTKNISPTLTVVDPAGNYDFAYQWNAPQDLNVDGTFETEYVLEGKAQYGNYSVNIQAGNARTTLTFAVVPADEISVSTDKPLYHEEETVLISGQVLSNGSPVGNRDVSIRVLNSAQTVKLVDQEKTSANGMFHSQYVLPVPIESGQYTVEVAYNGVKSTTVFNVSPEPPGSIGQFTGTSTTTSVSLSWGAVDRADAYTVKRDGQTIYHGTALAFTESNLTPDTAYSYQLIAENAGGSSDAATVTVRTVKLAPATPAVPTFTATTTSISLAWEGVTGAEGYVLKRNGAVVYEGTNLSFVDAGLTPGTAYSYELKAVNSGGSSSAVTVSASTLPQPPSAATNFTGTSTTTSVSLSWGAVERADAYTVKRDGQTIYHGTELTFTESNLTPDTAYSYQLIAHNAGGSSDAATVTVRTVKLAPATPAEPTFTAATTSISLAWESVTGAEGYVLKRNGEVIYEGTNLSFVDAGLTPGTAYSYELKAVNSGGSSSAVTVSASTLPQPPSAATNFTGTSTTTSVSLSWGAVERADAYTVKRDGQTIYHGTALTFTESNLTPDTAYSYQLIAHNAGGSSDAATVTVRTVKLAPATPILTSTATTSSISLTWTAVTGAESYELKRNGTVVYTGTNTTFTDANLTPNTAYSYELKAINSGGASTAAVATVRTNPLPPVTPPPVTPPPVTPPPVTPPPVVVAPPSAITGFKGNAATDSVTLTWEASQRAASYVLKRDGQKVYEGTALTFIDSKLTAGTAYRYELTAVNAGGSSAVAAITVTTVKLIVAPGTPEDFRSAVTTDMAVLNWSEVEGADTYELTRNGVVVYSGDNNGYVDASLKPGTKYTYSVKAVNSAGESAAATLTVVTQKALPGAVSGLTADATLNQITLTWNKAVNAERYIVKSNGKVIYSGTQTSFIIKGLKANTSYSYTVSAVNSSGQGKELGITVKTKSIETTTKVTVAKAEFKRGETVTVTVKVTDKNKKALVSVNVVTVITDPSGKKQTFNGKTNKDGEVVISYKTSKSSKTGAYKVTAATDSGLKDAYSDSSASAGFRLK